MLRLNPATYYTRDNLAAYWKELGNLPKDIQKQKDLSTQQKKLLDKLQQDLAAQNVNEQVANADIERFTGQIRILQLQAQAQPLIDAIEKHGMELTELSLHYEEAEKKHKPIMDRILKLKEPDAYVQDNIEAQARQQARIALLQEEYKKKLSLDIDLANLKFQVEDKRELIDSTKLQLEPLNEEHNTLMASVGISKNNLVDTRKQLDAKNKILAELKAKHEAMAKEIEVATIQASANAAALQQLENREKVLASNKLLKAWNDDKNPGRLLDELMPLMKVELERFNLEYPADQSLKVRAVLLTLQAQADLILANKNIPGNTSVEKTHTQYCQLAGLLWKAHALTKNEKNTFSSHIDNILGIEAIAENEALAEFNKFVKTTSDKIFNLWDQDDVKLQDDVTIKEKELFKKAVFDFEKSLAKIDDEDDASPEKKDFYKTGKSLLAAIKEQKRNSMHSSLFTFDMKYYTSIITVADEVLRDPTNPDKRDHLADLAMHNTYGLPSRAKRIVGAIALFLGAAVIITASLFIGGVLPGVSWVASAVGITAGLLMLGAGTALIVHGRKKGIEKNLCDFQDTAASPLLRNSLLKHNEAPVETKSAQPEPGSELQVAAPSL